MPLLRRDVQQQKLRHVSAVTRYALRAQRRSARSLACWGCAHYREESHGIETGVEGDLGCIGLDRGARIERMHRADARRGLGRRNQAGRRCAVHDRVPRSGGVGCAKRQSARAPGGRHHHQQLDGDQRVDLEVHLRIWGNRDVLLELDGDPERHRSDRGQRAVERDHPRQRQRELWLHRFENGGSHGTDELQIERRNLRRSLSPLFRWDRACSRVPPERLRAHD